MMRHSVLDNALQLSPILSIFWKKHQIVNNFAECNLGFKMINLVQDSVYSAIDYDRKRTNLDVKSLQLQSDVSNCN